MSHQRDTFIVALAMDLSSRISQKSCASRYGVLAIVGLGLQLMIRLLRCLGLGA